MMKCTHGLLATLAVALVPAAALASSFTVDPLMVQLSARRTSQVVTLTNQSGQELRFEVKAFAWSHDDQGEMTLDATSDVVLFPSLITLKAGEKKNIRVGAVVKPAAEERSYRLFVEELPPAAEPGASGGSRVAMRTRVGIPVFISPAKATPH